MPDEVELPPWVKKFWSKVNKNGPVHPVLGTNCWLWTGSKLQPGGYGSFYFNGRTRTAHWVSYCLEYGLTAPDDHALHKCDVRLCVRPDHLFAGTPTDNARDMVEKMRGAGQKLGQDQVRSIVIGLRDGVPRKLLAETYRVTLQTISDIARGYTWRHLVDRKAKSKAVAKVCNPPGSGEGGGTVPGGPLVGGDTERP